MFTMNQDDAQKHGEMLGNRVAKNFRQLKKKMGKIPTNCFRLYDWDIPEVRAVVDYYAGHLIVSEYERRQTESIENYVEILGAYAARSLDIPDENLHLRTRHAGQGQRYEKLANQKNLITVQEREHQFLVNLDDYQDVGLFLDHPDCRDWVAKKSVGAKVLNLYSYTGSFSVYCAKAGAKEVTSVDRSSSYTEWTRDNFVLNQIDPERHPLLQGDSLDYLRNYRGPAFDIIILDPPSFSTAREDDALDILIDHTSIIDECMHHISKNGFLFFSTNHQRFVFDESLNHRYTVQKLSPSSIPLDYRNRQVHQAFEIRHSS